MSTPAFEYPLDIRLHDTDAAGLIFFGHLFRHAQDAYEAFMSAIGFPIDRMIRDGAPLLPIAHAEADFHRPMRHGDAIRVRVQVLEIRRRSYAIGYRFTDTAGGLMASARTIHVLVRTGSGQTRATGPLDEAGLTAAEALPEGLRTALCGWLEAPGGASPD